jgi:GDP/UDP-N,N'-diacetylbacillosamine 2-epimerase (hydrolysing)
MKEIQEDDFLELQVIVTGMHLSPEFGLSYQEIEKDFTINKKIEMLLSSDTSVGISKSMGLAQISFAEVYDELKPDIVVVLGDRYEIFSAVSAAMISRIPIAHIHGGETTEGAFDEAIRHAITKMSQLHFTSTEDYRRRVIQLGEHPDRVKNTGSLGVDNIHKLKLMKREELENSLNFGFGKKNFLVTFHPVTLEISTSKAQFLELLSALKALPDTHVIFTKANADTDGRVINRLIDEYVKENPHTSISFTSMGQIRYLSAMKYADAVVGNSSSGLIEAPSFKVPTINIGDRQKGRIRALSVIDCLPEKGSIITAIKKIEDEKFKKDLVDMKNPFGGRNTSSQIKNFLKDTDLKNILKKKFYDLKNDE